MSELTPCNYCSLQRLKWAAEKAGNVIVLRSGWRGGIDAFEVPPGVELSDSEEDREKYFRAWFMELGKQCGC